MDKSSGIASNTSAKQTDIIDHTIECLQSAVDLTDSATDRICAIMNRIAGPIPEPPGTPTSEKNPGQTIALCLGRLDQSQRRLNQQLDRFREQSV